MEQVYDQITIDYTQYEFEDLSDEAKNLLQSIQFLDNDITRLNARYQAIKRPGILMVGPSRKSLV